MFNAKKSAAPVNKKFPTETNNGTNQDFTLPDNVTTVLALSLKAARRTLDDMPELVTRAKLQEKCWAEHGIEKLNGDLSQKDCISWVGNIFYRSSSFCFFHEKFGFE